MQLRFAKKIEVCDRHVEIDAISTKKVDRLQTAVRNYPNFPVLGRDFEVLDAKGVTTLFPTSSGPSRCLIRNGRPLGYLPTNRCQVPPELTKLGVSWVREVYCRSRVHIWYVNSGFNINKEWHNFSFQRMVRS